MSLLSDYDALLVDLDGTIYRGAAAIPGADHAIRAAHQAGVGVRFVTNNASRSPEDVAEHLDRLGIPAKPTEITTSAQAGASLLVDRVTPGATVLVLGTEALVAAVTGHGYRTVRTANDDVRAVIQGFSPDLGWRDLAEAAIAIRAGALWVACNVDVTLPTERGLLPGSGSLVAAVRVATDATPLVAGKPERPLMDNAIRAEGAARPLAVGDRLDTDIAGAVNVGVDSLLVLTGVSTAAELLAAPAAKRPTYVAADLRGIEADDTAIAAQPGWRVETVDDTLTLSGHGDDLAALRALCAAWWRTQGGPVKVRPLDDAATAAVARLGLPAAS
ncbi:MAG TPA: HAD-IIA family hydrolase [Pseudonocardiaceae bacterium]|jgi:HAD superfamily hydrolase (TIGR01457 family)|nr:HAD-IIA family hydrolase [Pseudonocardiaceae bacterium]